MGLRSKVRRVSHAFCVSGNDRDHHIVEAFVVTVGLYDEYGSDFSASATGEGSVNENDVAPLHFTIS